MLFDFFKNKKPSKLSRTELGRRGEDEATRALKRSGYRIVQKNYRCRYGEVDIIATDGNVLCFVEVKTRRDDKFGSPKDAIDDRKARHMLAVAENYLTTKGLSDMQARIDVVSVEVRGERFHCEIIKNAVEG